MPATKTTNLDALIGSRIRTRRREVNVSQEGLANQLGITFQQIQKYEHGTNRVSASRLLQIAEVLNVPVVYFYPECKAKDVPPCPPPLSAGEHRAVEALRRMTSDQRDGLFRVIGAISGVALASDAI